MIRYVFGVVLAVSSFLAAPVPRPPAQAPRRPPHRGDSSCAAALDSLLRVLQRDYPGYRDRVVWHEAAFATLVDSVRSVAASPAADASYQVCIPALQRVTHFFRDAHLMLWQGSPPSATAAAPAGANTAPVPRAATADDPKRPTLRRYDARALVLRLPDLDYRYKPAVDSLVAADRPALTATPTLVVDLRGDGGGCTCTYDALMPLIATGPIGSGDGALDVWASPENVAWFRATAADPETPDTLATMLRGMVSRLQAAPNTFVPMTPDTAAALYTPRDVLPLPAAVAVLVDSACASSCEDFVEAARQSRKVTVFSATNTGGASDYGNIRSVMLPGWRRLRVATSRSRRLRAGIQAATDFVGLAPDVRLPRDSASGDAALDFALHRLRARRPGAR
jgi:hypothetical protein